MEHSKAYNELIEWCGLIGTRQGDYYLPDSFLDEIYDWERDEVEKIIHDGFVEYGSKTTYFAGYMPLLRNYDGMQVLKDVLTKSVNMGYGNSDIAAVLFDKTEDPQYLDIIMQRYSQKHDLSYVSRIARLIPTEDVFNTLAEIYVNDDNQVNRTTAATGLLHCKGYIDDVNDTDEFQRKVEISRRLRLEDKNKRSEIVKKLRNGEPI